MLMGLTQGVSALSAEMTRPGLQYTHAKAIVLPVTKPIMRRLRYRESAFQLLVL
jgi:hypothetical protein